MLGINKTERVRNDLDYFNSVSNWILESIMKDFVVLVVVSLIGITCGFTMIAWGVEHIMEILNHG